MLTRVRAISELFSMWPKIMKSKTIIVNVATLLIAVASAVANLEFIQQFPELTAFLSATLIPTANIILRFFTKEAVSKKRRLF